MKNLICAARAGLLALCLCAAGVHAGVVVGGTRVVFPAKGGEVTVRLSNVGTSPALVEAWIDDGDVHSTPDKVDVPFLVTPPLFRMEPNRDQSLRIIGTPSQLPADRESLFWLNVLEVPPKPTGLEAEGKNTLQFAVRSRLKLFYRPANLAGDPLKAPEGIGWKVIADGSGYVLEASNPSPYFVTFTNVSFSAGGTAYAAETGMVAPQGALRLAVKSLTQAPANGTLISYTALNDYGASAVFKGAISP